MTRLIRIMTVTFILVIIAGITTLSAQSVTFDVEDLQGLTRWHPQPGPFMFYHVVMGQQLPFFAWTGIDWDPERTTSSLVDTEGLDDLIDDDDELSLYMSGFDLHSFSHINVINPDEPVREGEKGDFRIYTGGYGYIKVNGQQVIEFKNLQVEVLVYYPDHVLPTPGPGDYTEAYGFGDINTENSAAEWVEKIAPDTGQVDFIFESFTSHIDEPDYYDGTIRIEGKEHKTEVASHIFDDDDRIVDFLNEVGLKFDFDYIEPPHKNGSRREDSAVKTMVAYQIFDDSGESLPDDIPSFNSQYYYRIDAVAGDFKCDIIFDLSRLSGLPDDLQEIVILKRPVTGCPDISWEKMTESLEVVSHDPPRIRIKGIKQFGEMAIGSLQEGTLPVDFTGNEPETAVLKGAFPNPFNIGTNISFYLAEPAEVTIDIYNTRGQLIKRLADNKNFCTGERHIVRWDGQDKDGSTVSTGVYLYLIQTGSGFRDSEKMLLLK